MTARAAVLGHPVGHSLSPVLHTAAYAALGLTDDWAYQALDCTEEDFPALFAGLGPQWRGLSLTMPLKRVVIPLLDQVSELARTVGAVNTVTWDGERRTIGDNTDVHGLVQALRSAGVDSVGAACILGAGATARSAMAALAELGCTQVQVQARSPQRASGPLAVADHFGVKASAVGLDQVDDALAADVLIVTLPAPAAALWAATALPAVPADASPRSLGLMLDVGYHPWPTAAATAWTASGGTVVGGFEMLLHQAGAQVELMTGCPAPLEAMRAAGQAALR